MNIVGIENIENTAIGEALLRFAYQYFPDCETVTIEEQNDPIYLVNEHKYIVINRYSAYELIEDYNNELLNEALYATFRSSSEVGLWIDYIDKDRWIEENGVEDFPEYWFQIYDEHINYQEEYNGIEIYTCG